MCSLEQLTVTISLVCLECTSPSFSPRKSCHPSGLTAACVFCDAFSDWPMVIWQLLTISLTFYFLMNCLALTSMLNLIEFYSLSPSLQSCGQKSCLLKTKQNCPSHFQKNSAFSYTQENLHVFSKHIGYWNTYP